LSQRSHAQKGLKTHSWEGKNDSRTREGGRCRLIVVLWVEENDRKKRGSDGHECSRKKQPATAGFSKNGSIEHQENKKKVEN